MGRVNKQLLPLKLLLFFLYGAIGCLPAFLTIHMLHIGLSHEEVTWINTVLPLTALVGPPFAGYLADWFGDYRLITMTTLFLAGLFHTALLFVPDRGPTYQPNLQMVCGLDGSSLVLQSCTDDCPKIANSLEGSFRAGNLTSPFEMLRIGQCRQECAVEGQYCGDIYMNWTGSESREELFNVNPEMSTIQTEDPILCLHKQDGITCHNFTFNTFIEVQTGLEYLQKDQQYFSRFDDCCEYPIKDFTTKTDFFNNITCNPVPGCHVVCTVNEITQSNDSYLIQPFVCSKDGTDPSITFWLYFCLRAVADMFPAILISLFDAVVLTMVAQHGGDYGRQKMFGLFAIGLSAPVVGYLMDRKIGVYWKYDYAPVFYVFDFLLIVTAVIFVSLPLKVDVKRTSMLKNLTELIHNSEFNTLVFIVIILGCLNGYFETFLYIYLSEDLGATNVLLGLTITAGIVPSLPLLYKSEPIVNYCGHHYLLILAFVGYCVRFAGLSYLSNPVWVIPLEILELFTINLMQVTAATLAYKLAPKTLVATAQGIVWISHFDIGRALGTVAGGYLIKEYGMIRVFQGASVFSAICATIYLNLYQVVKYLKATRARSLPPDEAKEDGSVSNNRNYMPLPVVDKKC